MQLTKGARTRARLVESMLELLQARGYSGTGMNAVTKHAAAPKGSLYFHFPEGKEALGLEAIELAASRFRALVEDASREGGKPSETVRRIIDVLSDMVTDSDFQLGCPVSVVTLEMGTDSDRLRSACATAFDSWIAPMAEYLAATGHPDPHARTLATALVSMVEGALIVSRAQRSVEPLRCARDVITHLVDNNTTNKGSTP